VLAAAAAEGPAAKRIRDIVEKTVDDRIKAAVLLIRGLVADKACLVVETRSLGQAR
jgi:hypothetical protein